MSDDLTIDNDIITILYDDTPPEWLVPGMLIRGTITCLAAEPGVGKSMLANTLGLAVATGVPALSGLIKDGEPRKVLYFDQENSRPDRNQYIQWAWRGLGKPNDGLLHDNFLTVSRKLGRKDWLDVASDYVQQWQPDLVYFDTAISCFDAESENDNSEAAGIINKIYQLLAIPTKPASALVLRHAKDNTERRAEGKNAVKKMRGATVWKSQVDQTLYLLNNRGARRKDMLNTTRIEPDKQRAFGFQYPRLFINPQWVNGETGSNIAIYDSEKRRSYGMRLDGSLQPDKDTRRRLAEEGEDDDE